MELRISLVSSKGPTMTEPDCAYHAAYVELGGTIMMPRCAICGRFLRRIFDSITGLFLRWQCVKAWYAHEGQWEHD